jgi:hypothetical protein
LGEGATPIPLTGFPTVAAGNVAGPAWVAIHFHADAEGNTSLGLDLPAAPAPSLLSWVIYHDGGIDPVPGQVSVDASGARLLLSFRCPGLRCVPADGTILLWVVGPVGAWNWTLRGEADASFYGTTNGPDVGAVMAPDFHAPTSVVADLDGGHATLVDQGVYGFSPDGITVGFAQAQGIRGTTRLSVDMPNGTTRACYCLFASLAPAAPGDVWTFHLTQADADLDSAPPVIFYARDIQLPD